MIPIPELPAEFRGRIDGRHDVAAEAFLRDDEGRGHLGEGHVAHHQHVHIAVTSELAPGRRAEHERGSYTVGERRQRFTDDFDDPGRLEEQGSQLREDRTLPVDLVVDVTSLDGPSQDPRVDEQL